MLKKILQKWVIYTELRPRVVDLLFIVIFYAKTSMWYVCADYLIIFWYLLTFFLATFFQKQASKDHLTQRSLLKTTLFNEKQSNLEKEMYGNISLYCQYFSPGTGSNVHKTYFYFLKHWKSILSSKIKKTIK